MEITVVSVSRNAACLSKSRAGPGGQPENAQCAVRVLHRDRGEGTHSGVLALLKRASRVARDVDAVNRNPVPGCETAETFPDAMPHSRVHPDAGVGGNHGLEFKVPIPAQK